MIKSVLNLIKNNIIIIIFITSYFISFCNDIIMKYIEVIKQIIINIKIALNIDNNIKENDNLQTNSREEKNGKVNKMLKSHYCQIN